MDTHRTTQGCFLEQTLSVHNSAGLDTAAQHGDVNPVWLNNGWSEPPTGYRMTSWLRHLCSSGDGGGVGGVVKMMQQAERERRTEKPACREDTRISSVMPASWNQLFFQILLLLVSCRHINTSKWLFGFIFDCMCSGLKPHSAFSLPSLIICNPVRRRYPITPKLSVKPIPSLWTENKCWWAKENREIHFVFHCCDLWMSMKQCDASIWHTTATHLFNCCLWL